MLKYPEWASGWGQLRVWGVLPKTQVPSRPVHPGPDTGCVGTVLQKPLGLNAVRGDCSPGPGSKRLTGPPHHSPTPSQSLLFLGEVGPWIRALKGTGCVTRQRQERHSARARHRPAGPLWPSQLQSQSPQKVPRTQHRGHPRPCVPTACTHTHTPRCVHMPLSAADVRITQQPRTLMNSGVTAQTRAT